MGHGLGRHHPSLPARTVGILAGYRERYPEVSVHQEVATSQPAAEALLTAAENADLLIVGTHGRGTFRATLLGSVSHAVVHYAPCPVAVVR
ncbi:universal stress protein [Saccharopolyspora spinosporotrichia]